MESSSKKVRIQASDGEEFEVEEAVALMSCTIKHLIEHGLGDDVIPLPLVTGNTLSMVLKYCNKHVKGESDDLKDWDDDFVNVDTDTLFDLIMAANYMDVKGLLDLVCEKVASLIRGKTPEEIRKTFNIKNDFTPEEEEVIRKENPWAFQQ